MRFENAPPNIACSNSDVKIHVKSIAHNLCITCCKLLLIEILSLRFCRGIDFLQLVNEYIVWDEIDRKSTPVSFYHVLLSGFQVVNYMIQLMDRGGRNVVWERPAESHMK